MLRMDYGTPRIRGISNMRSTKIGRKILVGILCAAMVVQCVPAEAVASEIAEIVQSYDQEALDKTEPQEENVETNVELGSSELEVVQVTSEINTEEAPEEAEKSDMSEISELSEENNAVNMSSTSEETSTSETLLMTEETSTSETLSISEEASTIETSSTTEESDTLETLEISEIPDIEETEEIVEAIETLEMDTDSSETETTSTEEETTVPEVTPLPDYNKLLSVVSEDKYYFYDNGQNKVEEIFVKFENCEIPESGVEIEFYIDKATEEGNQCHYDKWKDYYVIPLNDIEEGSHSLTVKLKDVRPNSATEGQYLVTRENIEFILEQVDNVFTEAEKYYVSSSDDTIEVTFFNPADDIESVHITASNGDIVARSNGRSKAVEQEEDPRYTRIGDGYSYEETILYKTTWVLSTDKNALEVGNYDIRLTLKNGTERMIPNVVEVSSKAVVTKCVLGTDYDNTSNFVYLYIQGSGFNPSQIRFDFEDKATSATLSTTRIDYKTVQSGFIVKFRKEGNWEKAGKEIIVNLVKRSGNIEFTQTEFEAQLESGIYYAEYNSVLEAIEVGVTTDLNGKAVSFKIVDAEDHETVISEVTSRSLTESLAYLIPSSPDSLSMAGHIVWNL